MIAASGSNKSRPRRAAALRREDELGGRRALRRGVTRGGFMKGGALALGGTSTISAFLTRSVLAEMTTGAAKKKKLVVLFQGGGVDGLNVVGPYTEKNYYTMRPSI